MKLAREGIPFVVTGLVVTLALAAGTALLRTPSVPATAPASEGWTWLPTALFAVLTLFIAYFFRDPERTIPTDPDAVVAPGDGKVIEITTVNEPTFFRGRARRISIFLSVFNVHVQRSPVAGRVRHRSYRPGEYAVAWHPKASERNEQASVGLEADAGRVLVRQIAGLIARRIITYPQEGGAVERGERIGLIRFGSRVDLFLPLDWTLLIEVGDRVAGGIDIVARSGPPSRLEGGTDGPGSAEAGAPRSAKAGARKGGTEA